MSTTKEKAEHSTKKTPHQTDSVPLLKDAGYQFSTCAGEFECYHNWYSALFSAIRHEAISDNPAAAIVVEGLASIGTFLIESSNDNVTGYVDKSEQLWGQITAYANDVENTAGAATGEAVL